MHSQSPTHCFLERLICAAPAPRPGRCAVAAAGPTRRLSTSAGSACAWASRGTVCGVGRVGRSSDARYGRPACAIGRGLDLVRLRPKARARREREGGRLDLRSEIDQQPVRIRGRRTLGREGCRDPEGGAVAVVRQRGGKAGSAELADRTGHGAPTSFRARSSEKRNVTSSSTRTPVSDLASTRSAPEPVVRATPVRGRETATLALAGSTSGAGSATRAPVGGVATREMGKESVYRPSWSAREWLR